MIKYIAIGLGVGALIALTWYVTKNISDKNVLEDTSEKASASTKLNRNVTIKRA